MGAQESAVAELTPELFDRTLEGEMGGVDVYRLALLWVREDALKTSWFRFLEQTERHVEIVREPFERLGLDPETTTPDGTVTRVPPCDEPATCCPR